MSPKKIAIAATTFACMTLLSFSWSEQSGVSLSVASAQAKTRHVAAAHRHWHAHGANPLAASADVAAGAVDVAAAITSPWTGAAWQGAYYGPSEWGDFDCRPGFAGCRPYAVWGTH